MVTKKLSAFSADSFFLYVLFWGRGEQCSPVFRELLLVGKTPNGGRPQVAPTDFVCLFLLENHKLADDIVKYQHHNVCHYLCYPIVETEK